MDTVHKNGNFPVSGIRWPSVTLGQPAIFLTSPQYFDRFIHCVSHPPKVDIQILNFHISQVPSIRCTHMKSVSGVEGPHEVRTTGR